MYSSYTKALVLAAVGSVLSAQVPPGWAAYSHINDPVQGMPGGISLFDPDTGTIVALTGNPLPAELLGNAVGATSGPECVLVRDSDGVIFAGVQNRNVGTTTNVYRIDLNGTAVTNVTAYAVGPSSTASYIEQMQWLPDGNLLFAYRGITGLAQGVGTLDVVTGTVTLRNAGIATPFVRALAISPDGNTAYIGTSYNNPTVFRMPLNTAGYAQILTTLPATGPYQMQVDHQDLVYVATYPTGIHVVNPNVTPVTTSQLAPIAQPSALGIDRVTGLLLVGTIGPAMTFSWFDPGTQTSTPIAATYPAESPTAVSYRHKMAPYGSAAAGTNVHTWQWTPNPGGVPSAGNLGFSVTMNSTPGSNVGILAISGATSAPYNIPSPSVQNIQVSAALLGAWLLVLPPAPVTTPLPIPPGLPSMDVYLQTFHLDNNAWLGTQGLRLSIR